MKFGGSFLFYHNKINRHFELDSKSHHAIKVKNFWVPSLLQQFSE